MNFRYLLAVSMLLIGSLGGFRAMAEESEKQVVIVEDADSAPAFGKQLVEKAVKALPVGYKIRMTLDRFFDNGNNASTLRFEPFVYELVYLNTAGEEDGEQQFFKPRSRNPLSTVTWVNGRKQGPERVYNVHPRYLKTEVPWVNGQIQGTRRTFHPDGKPASTTSYVKGRPHGVATTLSADGTLMRECTLKNGKRDGTLTDYWPETGKPRRTLVYAQGKVIGSVKQYYENGKLKSDVPFKDDVMHGEEKRFEDDGKPMKSRYWLNGDLASKTEFELKYR